MPQLLQVLESRLSAKGVPGLKPKHISSIHILVCRNVGSYLLLWVPKEAVTSCSVRIAFPYLALESDMSRAAPATLFWVPPIFQSMGNQRLRQEHMLPKAKPFDDTLQWLLATRGGKLERLLGRCR